MPFNKALVALIAAGLAPAYAQSAAPLEVAAADPDTIIVTASRVAEKAGETQAPVTVITREDIDRLQPRDLPELLNGLPGVNLVRNGGPGKASSLFMRGTNGDHLVVLIDGLKAGSATLGTTAYEQIPVDLIDHIEIVRGPRSSLYGSEAIGGVIQIFTRRGSAGGAATPAFSLGGGNYGSGKAEGSVRGGYGRGGWYSVGLSASTTDGINVKPAGDEPDHDGFRSASGSLNTGWTFANGATLDAHYLRADSHNEYDGSYSNEAYNRQQLFGGRARFAPLPFWDVTLGAGQSQDFGDSFHDTPVDDYMGGLTRNRGSIDTYRDSYSWQNDLRLGAGQTLSAGVDFAHDRVGGDTAYAVDTRDNTGVFAQYQLRRAGHELQLSGRHDDNQQYGTHDTGALAYAYRWSEALHAGVSYASAFKAPSFNDLYYPGYGNAALAPESAHSVELSAGGDYRFDGGRWNWALNGYRTTVDQLIVYNPLVGDYGAPDNIGEARILGAEAQLGAQHGALRSQLYLNWLDAENRSDGASKGKALPRRARQTARVDLDYDWRAVSLGGTVFASGERYDNTANTVKLGGYATLDLRADWRVRPAWTLQLKAANLLDHDYQTASGYGSLGTGWFFTVRYAPAG
ncbi:TonB-dependent receptor domain-containing protein [Solimonas variicoloris]|uniref:TonB-dependent receptor domain-containing protein n=1 Tax=Solimonas variicoloris TaxID=254408 RepID=UPI0003784FD0|nr:TonB-dependent receptor [Solimonas variicoloris]